MGNIVTTMTVIVVANAIVLPLAGYGCIRLGVLPGVRWYSPFGRRRDEPGPMVRVVDDFSSTKGYGFIALTTRRLRPRSAGCRPLRDRVATR